MKKSTSDATGRSGKSSRTRSSSTAFEPSIFLDAQTNDLFGYAEIDSEARWAAIATTDVCRRWWRYMRDVMKANADDSPASRELREVFHVEAG